MRTKQTLALRPLLWLLMCFAFPFGCGTTLGGNPHFPGGRSGCEQRCEADGLEMAGLVWMGEYSSACVCGTPNIEPTPDDVPAASEPESSFVVPTAITTIAAVLWKRQAGQEALIRPPR